MKIGVIGIGVIGSAVVEGFCFGNDQEHELFISPRSEKRSLLLEDKYSPVTRCRSNQEVLDKSEIILISVLPKIGLNLLRSLKFKKTHRVINLMSDKKLDEIEGIIGKTKSLNHLVPLSFISKREGPIALYPKNNFIEALLSKLGHIIAVDDVKKIESIAAITGLMTSYYHLLNEVTKWGEKNDLSYEESLDYTTSFFEALAGHAKKDDLDILAGEMTPGGLNELALRHIEAKGGFDHWIDVLEPMLKRVAKQ